MWPHQQSKESYLASRVSTLCTKNVERREERGGAGRADDVIIVVLKAQGHRKEMEEANKLAVKHIMETK